MKDISPGVAIYAYIGTIGFIYLAVLLAEYRRRQRDNRRREQQPRPNKRRIPPHT